MFWGKQAPSSSWTVPFCSHLRQKPFYDCWVQVETEEISNLAAQES